VVTLVFLTLTAIGSFHVRWNYHVPGLHRANSPHLALTFDDGPSDVTEEILNLLAPTPHKATFFLIGKRAEERPDVVKKILAQGHAIGNHTYTHSPRLGFLSAGKVEDEIRRCDSVLYSISGKTPRFYRPPFGVTNPSIAKALKRTGHRVMGWSIRSLDTQIQDPEKIFSRIAPRLGPGEVVLLHDTTARCVLVLQRLLPELEKRNLRSITLEELHDEVAYC
jgi:peptidoglycan/xylan/chitin deacetylase (PgdA/CDA1 family)